MPFGLGTPELLIILAIALLVFGAGKLSDAGGALGKSVREFRKASRGEDEAPAHTPSKNGATPSAKG